ncbi:PadR family transcriptional regulator [Kordiimonas sp. SCSIO 12610]|uniref:PadR family transcriptional regulator n=1 Tax=Kordiimonas sp. SCSIO 12610 TaxID=2829597 RepID=UPI00210B8336|nr:PadR family transcriptional regulator [Kordiimonas sp. SCSIO 12610]UTW53817.1 PadR family transcriptional regulator [Kordiimonas sp. SCSIO 12610]
MKTQVTTDTKWDVQLRKGTLELVVLAALKDRRLYGLEILNLLHSLDTMKITEGTLYPLLDRLKRDGVVTAEWQQNGDERPRKYYQLTESGADKLESLTNRWRKSVQDIECLLKNNPQNNDSKRG